jgi:ectoine hydroxylase-related dioxygenase (phytanoyl-CoA dioxygenase family)
MPVRLSKSQIDEFYDIGFIKVPNVFNQQEINEIGACMDRLQEMASHIKTTTVYKGTQFVVEGNRIDRIVWCGAAEPKLLQYSADPRLLSPVSQLLGSKQMQQLICQMHPKIAGDKVAFDWHQDSQHRGYGTPDWRDVNGKGSYVQALTAIDEVTEDNGPVLFIPQSGKNGHLGLDKLKEPGKAVPTEKAVPLLMKPGTVAFFTPYVVHGSYPNNSDGPRRVFINGYAYPGANSRQYPGEGSGRILEI